MAWVSEEMLGLTTLSPQEALEALGEFKFSWSNSIISDSTVNPSILTSACATTFSSVENDKVSLAKSPYFVRVRKSQLQNSLN